MVSVPRVWSCSMFYNELDVLEIRLAELYDVVDVFVIVEATKTHMGAPRELVFHPNRDRFAQWQDKIRYIAIEFPDDVSTPWGREGYQREQAGLGLTGLQPNDLVIVSDIDEILRASFVDALRRGQFGFKFPISISLPIYPYQLNWKWDTHTDGQSRCSIITGDSLRECPGGFAGIQYRLMEANKKTYLVGEYGWHFTYIGDADRIVEKSYSIADNWVKGLATRTKAAEAIRTGVDVYGRHDRTSHRVPLEDLPLHVQQHKERFQHILGEEEPSAENSTLTS